MDIYGCSGPPTKTETVMCWIIVFVSILCWVVGLPMIFFVGLVWGF